MSSIRFLAGNQGSNGFVDGQNFMDGGSAFVTGIIADMAATAPIQGRQPQFASSSFSISEAAPASRQLGQIFNQSLGHYPGQGVGDHIGFDAHILEPDHRW